MKRHTGPILVPLVIACACISLALFVLWFRPSFVVPLEIAATDYLLLRPDGPRLGIRPTHDDIVLVMADKETLAERNGSLANTEETLDLYR